MIEALADRLRLLLRTKLVCVLLRREGPFELKAVSAETPQLATSARARHDRQTLRFAADLAQKAVTAGEPITLSIGADVHSLGSLVSPGMLIAAPFRTATNPGRNPALSPAGRHFHRGRASAGCGHRRFRRRRRGPCRTACHVSCPGPRTSPVARDLLRTQLQQRSGPLSASLCPARLRFPRLRPLLHRLARGRTVPGSLSESNGANPAAWKR